MAFRRPVRVQESSLKRFLKRVLLTAVLLIALLTAAALLFINGSTVRRPLEELLTKALGSEVSIAEAEFSPLYPQVIKLRGVKIAGLSAEEIYAEYSLLDLMREHRLHFYDLYIKDAGLPPEDLQSKLLMKLLPLQPTADLLRLNSLPVKLTRLKAKDAVIRLHQAALAPDNAGQVQLTFASGEARLKEAAVDKLALKSLSVSFSAAEHGFKLNELQAELLGGSVSGSTGFLDTQNNKLTFDELNLSRLILKDGLEAAAPYRLSAARGYLSELFYTPLKELNLSALSGSFEGLSLTEGALTLTSFSTTAAQAAVPALGLNVEEAALAGSLAPDLLHLQISGRLLEGSLKAEFTLKPEEHELTLHDLELAGTRLELHPEQRDFVRDALRRLTVHLESGSLSQVKFLSFLPELPLSIESLSAQAAGLLITNGHIKGDSAGLINAQWRSLLYADLLSTQGSAVTTITDELLSFALPQLTLRRSSLSLSGALSFSEAPSFLIIDAPDFAAEDLNSSLIDHLLQGRVRLQAELRAPGPFSAAKLKTGLSGNLSLKAPELLISKLGLDLINGGDLKERVLDGSTLLTALAAADIGLYNLNLSAGLKDGKVTLSGSARTPASDLTLKGELNLSAATVKVQSILTSLPGDSATELKAEGSLKVPVFTLKPLSRGEARPGLFTLPGEELQPEPDVPDVPDEPDTAQPTAPTPPEELLQSPPAHRTAPAPVILPEADASAAEVPAPLILPETKAPAASTPEEGEPSPQTPETALPAANQLTLKENAVQESRPAEDAEAAAPAEETAGAAAAAPEDLAAAKKESAAAPEGGTETLLQEEKPEPASAANPAYALSPAPAAARTSEPASALPPDPASPASVPADAAAPAAAELPAAEEPQFSAEDAGLSAL